MAMNYAQAYQKTTVTTASPAELTLMLYDGAIKFCNIAVMGLEKNDIQKVNTNIVKAQKIIVELRATLDTKYEVAKDFDRIYDFIYSQLIEANVKKEKEPLEIALEYIRDMRDTWKEVMTLNGIKVK